MGTPNENHRPLTSGLRILTRRFDNTWGAGTLTGVAYRNGVKGDNRVLVTNLHVMAGMDEVTVGRDRVKRYRNPRLTEVMHQGSPRGSDKVGAAIVDHEPVSLAANASNEADIAIVSLEDASLETRSAMHNFGAHTYRKIVQGTMDPTNRLPVKMVCGVSREFNGEISDADDDTRTNGTFFDGVMQITLNSDELGTFRPGDSGSPVLSETSPGVFKMVGIYYAFSNNNPKVGYAFRASLAERLMDITFGKRPPACARRSRPDRGRQCPRRAGRQRQHRPGRGHPNVPLGTGCRQQGARGTD